MASIARIAAILAHEALHEGTGNHCRRSGNDLRCCHNQISGSVIAGLSGVFGLPAALGGVTMDSFGRRVPARRDLSSLHPRYHPVSVGSIDPQCDDISCGPYRNWGGLPPLTQHFRTSCLDAFNRRRPVLRQILKFFAQEPFRPFQRVEVSQRFADPSTDATVQDSSCGILSSPYSVNIPEELLNSYIQWRFGL